MIVYKTTNIKNGMIYIGSDQNEDPNYLGSGILLKRAIKKYGIQNFKKEILYVTSNIEDLKIMETKLIREYNATNRNIGYNISDGYWGGDTLSNHPNIDKIKKKISNKVITANEKIQESRKKYFDNESYDKKMQRIINVKNAMKSADFSYFKTDEYRNNVSKGIINSTKFREYCKNRGKRGKYKVTDKRNERYDQLYKIYQNNEFCDLYSSKDHTSFSYALNVILCYTKTHLNKNYQKNVRSLISYVLWNTRNNKELMFCDLEKKYNELLGTNKNSIKYNHIKRILTVILDIKYVGRPENRRIKYARLNSFLTKGPGTWGRPINDPVKGGPKGSFGADADVAQEVIKGGHDKKLK